MRAPFRKQPTRVELKAQMMLHLYQCRPEALQRINSADLARRYKVDAKVAEYELRMARQRQGAA